MLVLAGAGLGPGYQGRIVEELLGAANIVYVDTYTMPGADWLAEYAASKARKVVAAERRLLEDEAARIVEEARESLVVILVPGDPLIATTHRSILVEAAKRGVAYKVIPGVSGVCAAKTLSLLDYYRFGRTITVPGPWRMIRAYSLLEYISQNACIGLHTLLLLDISPRGDPLPPGQAAAYLVDLAHETGIPGLAEAPAILVSRAGLDGEAVKVYKKLADLAGETGQHGPASIVLPGQLTLYERETIQALTGVDPGTGIPREEACRWLRVLEAGIG